MCKGPGKDWQRCFSCPFDDCTWEGATLWEREQAERRDARSSRDNGTAPTARQVKRAARYLAHKDQARSYYQANKERYSAYYQKNKEKIKRQSLQRYYDKVRSPSFLT